MRDLRHRIEMLLEDYRDKAANEERFVSDVLAVLAMGSVARARMVAEIAQIVARHSASLRVPAEEREIQDGIHLFARNVYDSAYR